MNSLNARLRGAESETRQDLHISTFRDNRVDPHIDDETFRLGIDAYELVSHPILRFGNQINCIFAEC